MLYLDTNIFIYAADKTQPQHKLALQLLHQAASQKLPLITSVETIQEIVHTFKKAHKLKFGLQVCRLVLKLVPHIVPIDRAIITEFLKLAAKYPKPESRDCLHLATCLVHKLPTLVTEDKTLLKTKIPKIDIKSPHQLSLQTN